MGYRLHQWWIDEMTEKMTSFRAGGDPIEITTAESNVKSWMVINFDKFKIPFAVYSLGAGVSKITTDTQVCPKCKGSGRIATK